MKFGLVVIVALVLSAFGAHFLLEDPGYVVIEFRGYLVEMSVPVLLSLILVALVTAWMAVRLVRAPRQLGRVAGRYRAGRAGQKLTRGMIEIAEGNFARGEKLLSGAVDVSEAPLLNYLQAARAAHLLGNDERRDAWLKEAYEQMPEAASAVLLTQAELQLDQGQYEQALATLRRLEEDSPNHGHALQLLGRLYYRLEDWDHLGELLPRLRKHGRLDESKLKEWSLRVHREKLERAADGDVLAETWRSIPRSEKRDLSLLEAYYRGLIRAGLHDQAEKGLARELKKEWRPPLVTLFGMVDSSDPAKQLRHAENWLKDNPEDADLLLTAARLCLRNELWGKARSYLETVISIRPTPEAYQEYGQLLNRLGEADAAADAFREGLGLVAASPLPAIPHLVADVAFDAEAEQ